MRTLLRLGVVLVLLSTSLVTAQDDDIQAQLDALIAEIAPPDGAAVSARISVGGETWTATGGLVDIAGTTPTSPDDRFRIASMSKPFMAATLMILQDNSVLNLDDPITQWLPPEITDHIANGDSATIYHLVTMTSGIPDYFDDDFYAAVAEDTTHIWTAEEAVAFAYDEPATFPVGEGYEYSNTNYVLLQLIVEAATDEPFSAVVRRTILDPLELKNTYTQIDETLPGGFVHGYEDFDGDGIEDDVTDINDGAGLADGGLISNTADLVAFYQGWWRNGLLMTPEAMDAVLSAADDENQYGIGIEVLDTDYGTVVGHTGGVLGFTGAVYYALDLDAAVVILYGNQGLDEAHTEALLEIAAQAAEEADD